MPGRNGCPGNEAPSIERAARELGAQSPMTKGYQEQSVFGMISLIFFLPQTLFGKFPTRAEF